MNLRASLCVSLVLVVAAVAAPGCGGKVIGTVGGDGGPGGGSGGGSGSSSGGGSGSSSGGGSGSSSGGGSGSSSGVVTLDAGPVGPCQDDGVPCITASQCCTGVCQGQVCGGELSCASEGQPCGGEVGCCGDLACAGSVCEPIEPECLADGSPCSISSSCCDGVCSGSVCGGSSVSCGVPPGATACEQCLATSCCQQLVACGADTTCESILQCFEKCATASGGSPLNCAQTCQGTQNSTAWTGVENCGIQSCINSCE